ncbi:MAG: energy-coupling factor transporter transmembrane protein EcfT [Alphaproteobacteria bacterium]|nr:energy-coupling factor transporter transmembrane protein EcfT [Alphaproteobacteria bacterium]
MIDPRTRLFLVTAVGVLAICLEQPGALGALVLATLLPLAVLRVPGVWWRRGVIGVLTIVWSTVLSQGLFYAEQPRVALVELGPLVLWREGVRWGLVQSLRFVAVSLAGLGLAVSTSPDRLYAAMLRLRVPFGLALMATTALRMVPAVGQELWTVRRARAARGRPAWRRAPWRWLALEVGLLRPVVARAWRRAHALAESLDARGFDPLAPRAVRRPLRMGALDGGIVVGVGLVTATVVALRVLYLLYVGEVLYVPALRGVYGFVRGWL